MRTLTQWAPIAVLILTWTLAGCDRQAQIATGIYVVQGAAKQSRAPYNESDHEFEQASAPELASIFLDRENTSVWIRYADGSLVVAGFTARQEAAWSLGCPTNTGSTRMEVVDIGRDSMAIGSATIQSPFLVRDCSPEPVMLALRGEGEINGAGAACTGTPTCVLLTWATEAYNLPRSMKGYELYSWRTATEGVWTYTWSAGSTFGRRGPRA